jgi:hypothetical protein
MAIAVKSSGDAPLRVGGASMIATGQTPATPARLLRRFASAAEASIEIPFQSVSNSRRSVNWTPAAFAALRYAARSVASFALLDPLAVGSLDN